MITAKTCRCMQYEKIYWSIISTAILRDYPDGDYEAHHIIPRSEGGSNKKSNKVRLTPKEHHICHLCLIKLHKCVKYCFRHLTCKEYIQLKNEEKRKKHLGEYSLVKYKV